MSFEIIQGSKQEVQDRLNELDIDNHVYILSSNSVVDGGFIVNTLTVNLIKKLNNDQLTSAFNLINNPIIYKSNRELSEEPDVAFDSYKKRRDIENLKDNIENPRKGYPEL